MAKRWTLEEDALLKEIYTHSQKDTIIKKLGKNWSTIHRRAIRLNLRRDPDAINKDRVKRSIRKDAWTPEEEEKLRKIYEHSTKDFIIDQINRPWKGIWSKAYALGLRRDPDIILKESIEGGKKAPPRNDFWTEDEYNLLKEIYEHSTKEYILKKINRPWQSIRMKALKLGLKRYPDIVKKDNVLGTSNAVMKKYGVKYTTLLPQMKEKSRQTNIARRGVEYPMQSADVKEKNRETTQKKYGVDNVFQSHDIKEKIKKTNIEKYGVKYPTQNNEVMNKILNTTKEKNSFESSDEELAFYIYLKKIDPQTEHQVINPLTNSYIDFYVPKYNIWIQYDGDYWHGKIKGKQDTPRERKIKLTVERDKKQNLLIPNLVRFSFSEVSKHIKKGSILNYIKEKIEEKTDKDTSCHQYRIKKSTLKNDLETLNFDPKEIKASDFILSNEPYSSDIAEFIKKYEWLRTVGTTPKWCFTARYKFLLGGVVLINEPNAYSNLLGPDTQKYEALIQRGATASWTPKNLGSRLIMHSCKWMVKNTPKRLFVCYADPKAHEIGTIYQACNFDYLGNNFGSGFIYQNKNIKNGIPFSAQSLKRTSSFRAWCKNNSIQIQPEWIRPNGYKDLNALPPEIKKTWNSYINKTLSESNKIPISKKHKYALLLGRDKKNFKELTKIKNYKPKKYPKRTDNNVPHSTSYIVSEDIISKLFVDKRKSSTPSNSRITPEKDTFIINNYKTMTQQEIANNINETKRWVSGRIKRLIKDGRLASKNPLGSTRSRLSEHKLKFIKNNRDKMTYDEMADHLSETKRWVKRQVLKLNKVNYL